MYGGLKRVEKTTNWLFRQVTGVSLYFVARVGWGLVIIVLLAWLFLFSDNISSTDTMAFGGFVAVILGITYSVLIDRSQRKVIESWHHAGIIDVNSKERVSLQLELRKNEILATTGVASLIVAATLFGYYKYIQTAFSVEIYDLIQCGCNTWEVMKNGITCTELLEFAIASVGCAVLVGMRLGRLVAHGLIGGALKKSGVRFRVLVGHRDGMGGWSLIGRFYIIQTSVLLVPVVWLLIWLIRITDPAHGERYNVWVEHFYTLVGIALLLFVFSYLKPIVDFGRFMRSWKVKYLYPEVSLARRELAAIIDAPVSTLSANTRRVDLMNRFQDLSSIPNWPVSKRLIVGPLTFFATLFASPKLIEFITVVVFG